MLETATIVYLILSIMSEIEAERKVETVEIPLRNTLMGVTDDASTRLINVYNSSTAHLILGVTPSCYVYFGWMEQIFLAHTYGTYTFEDKHRHDCRDIQPVALKTENTNRQLYIGLKRNGRRIQIQSLFEGEHYKSNNKDHPVLWRRFDPTARHQQFLSNEFEKGFNYRGAFTYKGRVILYGHDYTNVLLLELSVAQSFADYEGGVGNLLVPFIRTIANISNDIIAPENVYVQHFSVAGSKEEKFFFGRAPPYGETIANGIMLSVASVMKGRKADMEYVETFKIYISKAEQSNVAVYQTHYARNLIGNYYLIEKKLNVFLKSAAQLPHVLGLLRGHAAQSWLNPYRFSRRMSYPNTIHRMQQNYIFSGWKTFTPVFISNVVIFMVLMYATNKFFRLHHKMMQKIGAYSTSYSSANSL
ncbi:hypothetical protein RB195_010636 [Necator americanus]|uniref:Uncharacterized protein n=1 Tax=Necator americanus TaxID=51031 RepID=A0ABR1D048_NECAM